MPFVQYKVNKIDLGTEMITKTLDAKIRRDLRVAGRAFLREVYPHVPVWTGEARGSLLNLANYLHVHVPIKPVANRKGHSPATGRSQGYGVYGSSHEFIRAKGNIYYFRFESKVPHYTENDANVVDNKNLKHPTPWKSFEYGKEAFMAVFRERMRDIRIKDLKKGRY